MKKKIVLTGASGMIGGLLLDIALKDDQVGEVISLVRKPSGIKDSKLKEIVMTDFLDYSGIKSELEAIDVVFYCLGVYTGKVAKDEFRKITVDYPAALAKAVIQQSPMARFCLLSGQGADRTEKSAIQFAKDKGAIENILSGMGFAGFHSFRPSYIYPVTARKEPNFTYRAFRVLYPLVKLLGKNFSIRSTELASAMYKVGLNGASKEILENRDIIEQA